MTALGLVVAEFNRPITEEMEREALEAASAAGAEVIETVRVPGAYDAPLAADRLARRSDVDAVAVVGSIITGDTDHDRVIADAAAGRLSDVSLERDTPVTLGITGPGMSAAEARERVGNAAKAVEGAIDLVSELPDPGSDRTSGVGSDSDRASDAEPEPERASDADSDPAAE